MKRRFCILIAMCVILTALSFSVFGQENDTVAQTTEPIATMEPEPIKQIYIDAATDEVYESEEAFFETHNREKYNLIIDLTYPDHQTIYIVPASGENCMKLKNKIFIEMGYPQWVIE